MNRNSAKIFIFLSVTLISVLFTGLYHREAPVSKESEMPLYIMKDYKGNPAVFPFLSDEPESILQISTLSLPETDRKILQQGISIYSEEELFSLIEDYSS